MTYDALTISRYIIDFSDRENFNISNLKLQKLLYFVQCHFLMQKNDICFKDNIEAWNLGPVIPSVYREYKKFGAGNIPSSYVHEKIKDDYIEFSDKELISDVVVRLSEYSAMDLVDITHRQAPWKDVYVQHENNEITIDSIRKYFSER